MKECKHTYEAALEQIERMIEAIDPDETVNVSDFTKRFRLTDRKNETTKATKMLLKKYGIRYREESKW